MTTHTRTRRPGTPRTAGHPYRDHTVTGTPTQLANLITNHRTAGTLIAMTAPRPVGDRFQMVIRLRAPQHTRPTSRITTVGEHTRTRRTRIAAIVTAITGVLAGLAAVAAYLIGRLVELITMHAGLILGVLVLLAVLAGVTAGSSRRRHCPGC